MLGGRGTLETEVEVEVEVKTADQALGRIILHRPTRKRARETADTAIDGVTRTGKVKHVCPPPHVTLPYLIPIADNLVGISPLRLIIIKTDTLCSII